MFYERDLEAWECRLLWYHYTINSTMSTWLLVCFLEYYVIKVIHSLPKSI